MKVLFTIVPESVAGGVYITEKAFLDDLAAHPTITIETLRYGKRRDGESLVGKVLERFVDLWVFRAKLRSFRPDVVHLNSALDAKAVIRDVPFTYLIAHSGARLFLKWHGTDVRLVRSRSFYWRMMLSFVISRATKIGVLSSEECRNLDQAGYDIRKMAVVKNCLPHRPPPPTVSSGSRERTRLLFVGRIMRSKGIFEVLEVVRRLVYSNTMVDLICVGSGIDFEECQRFVESHALGASVRMTGQVTELEAWEYYSSSDILVFPTYHDEGFPMTLLNSLAAGLAIVTTRIRAAADHLQEPDNCVWVRPQDPGDVEEKVRFLLANPVVRRSMGAKNRMLASMFTPEAVVRELLPLYGETRHWKDGTQ